MITFEELCLKKENEIKLNLIWEDILQDSFWKTNLLNVFQKKNNILKIY